MPLKIRQTYNLNPLSMQGMSDMSDMINTKKTIRSGDDRRQCQLLITINHIESIITRIVSAHTT